MDWGIRQRVEALRREIAEIQKLNLAYLQTPERTLRQGTITRDANKD